MVRRLPYTLWRTIAVELLRLFLLSTCVCVVVVAFAAAVKPLADGKLNPGDAILFMLLSIPPMLAYVLPFSGGFAATLVYYRLAQDNEAMAAQAGGVSLRALLAPALALSLVLAGSLTVLNEQAIPRFLRRMQDLVTMDIARVFTMNIPRGRPVEFGDVAIYADAVVPRGADPANPDVRHRLSFASFAAFRFDDRGAVADEFFAQHADAWFFRQSRAPGAGPGEGATEVRLRLTRPMSSSPGEGASRWSFSERSEGAIFVPEFFRDNPKYLTRTDLERLKKNPDAINWVDKERRELALEVARRDALRRFQDRLAQDGRLALVDERDQAVSIVASGIESDSHGSRWRLVPPQGADVAVEFTRPPHDEGAGGERLRATVKACALELTRSGPVGGPDVSYTLFLEKVRTMPLGADALATPGTPADFALSRLHLPDRPERALLAMPSRELLALAADAPPGEGGVARASDRLAGAIARLGSGILAKQNERLALAASAGIIALTGAVTALLLSRRQPLAVYLWTFVPALVCLVTISGGQQTVTSGYHAGLFLLWASVVALLAYTLVVYRLVARH